MKKKFDFKPISQKFCVSISSFRPSLFLFLSRITFHLFSPWQKWALKLCQYLLSQGKKIAKVPKTSTHSIPVWKVSTSRACCLVSCVQIIHRFKKIHWISRQKFSRILMYPPSLHFVLLLATWLLADGWREPGQLAS